MSTESYEKLKQLIVQEQVLLLPHKRFTGVRQKIVYARCGISQKYFEKAYKKGDVILQCGQLGPRIGYPESWEEAVEDFFK